MRFALSEITKEAFKAALGNKGVISISMEHSCADFSQQPLYETRILLQLLELILVIPALAGNDAARSVDGIFMDPTVRIKILYTCCSST